MQNRERLVKWTENGGVEPNKEANTRVTIQKNYQIIEEVAKGITTLKKQFGAKTEGEIVEEMYYTFMELLEKGKEQKKSNKRSSKKDDKAEVKEEK